jgi:hypothetical protein
MQTTNPQLRARIDTILDGMIERFYASAPAARHLLESDKVDSAIFKAHTVQTILRIRLARMADAKAIFLFAKTDPFAAKKWAQYAEEEMLHDKLFLKDLMRLGMTEAEVYGTEPLVATQILQGYLYYSLEHEGPRGLISKAYFLEYTSRKTQGAWNANIKRSLGEEAVKGAEAHLRYDVDEDHSTDVWNVLMTLVKSPADENRVIQHMNVFFGLFSAYFVELSRRAHGEALEAVAAAPLEVVRDSAWSIA